MAYLVIRVRRIPVAVVGRRLCKAVGVLVSDQIHHEAEHVVVDHFWAELCQGAGDSRVRGLDYFAPVVSLSVAWSRQIEKEVQRGKERCERRKERCERRKERERKVRWRKVDLPGLHAGRAGSAKVLGCHRGNLFGVDVRDEYIRCAVVQQRRHRARDVG